MIPTSLRHLRSIGRREPLRATPSPAFLRAFFGHAEQFAVNVGLASTALEQIGLDFDAVEWDWPRWGRRILVSGPWEDLTVREIMRRAGKLEAKDIDWNLYLAQLNGDIDPADQNIKVGDPLTPADLERATVIYQPYPHARHVEIGWAEPGKVLYPVRVVSSHGWTLRETQERRFFDRLRRAFRHG